MKTRQTIQKKAAKLLSSSFLIGLLGLFLVGCSDKEITGGTPPAGNEGDPVYVNFSASVRESRIAYGEVENNLAPVYWEPSDRVLIFSPANTRNHPVYGTDEEDKEDKNVIIKDANDQAGGYAVTTKAGALLPNSNSTQAWFTYLNDESDKLEWKVVVGQTQNFHAFYPYEYVEVSNDTVSGRVPAVQDATIPKNLLYAKLANVKRETDFDKQAIDFQFDPILNRLEITIKNPENLPVQAVRITSGRHKSRTQAVAGDLIAKMTSNFDPATGITFDATSNQVYRVFSSGEATQSEVSVGVSLLPQVYDSLNITVLVNQAGVIRSVTRLAAKKPSQYGRATRQMITFGSFTQDDLELEADNFMWMANVPDNTLISHLSIPGATMAGTESKNNNGRDRFQIDGIDDLLLNGVRALEFRCEDGSGNERAVLELYGLRRRGGATVGLHTKIQDVVRYLNDFPTETVIVLAMYSNNGDWSSDNRYGGSTPRTRYLNKMRYILNTYAANKIVQYRSGLTLGDCRGKILFLSPDEVFPGNEMGWDYYARAGVDYIDGTTYPRAASGKLGGLKDLKMIVTAHNVVTSPATRKGQGDTGEDLWLQLQRRLVDSSSDEPGKKYNAITTFLKDAAKKPANTWVINYATVYLNNEGTDYPANKFAENYYQTLANYINNSVEPDSDEDDKIKRPQGPTGIVFMDYAGTNKHKFSNYPNREVTLNGDKLLNAVINANWDYDLLKR